MERRSTPWWPLTFCNALNRCTLRCREASCIHWIKKKKKEMETLSRNYKISRNWTDLAFYQRLWSLRRVDMLIFIQSESNYKSNCDSTMIATSRGVTDALYGSKISCVIFHWMHVSVKTESKRYLLTRPLRTHSGFYFGGGAKEVAPLMNSCNFTSRRFLLQRGANTPAAAPPRLRAPFGQNTHHFYFCQRSRSQQAGAMRRVIKQEIGYKEKIKYPGNCQNKTSRILSDRFQLCEWPWR